MEDFYRILGVSPNAAPKEIKERFRFLAQAYHPDKFSSAEHKAQADEQFKRINEAYQVLADPQKRAEYDRRTHAEASQPETEKLGQRGQQEDTRRHAEYEQEQQKEAERRHAEDERQRREEADSDRRRATDDQYRKEQEKATQKQRQAVHGLAVVGGIILLILFSFITASGPRGVSTTPIATETPVPTTAEILSRITYYAEYGDVVYSGAVSVSREIPCVYT